MRSTTVAFVAIMGALGNVLFLVSFYAGPVAPGVAFDFSLTATFIAAFYGGPWIGAVTGLFVGLLPGVYFGPLGTGSWLGLVGLPIGKSLTGLASGVLARRLDLHGKKYSSLATIPVVLVSYIPECLFTVAYFVALMPYFLGGGGIGILVYVIPKAWVEIAVISVLMGALNGNQGFTDFVRRFLANNKKSSSQRLAISG